MIGRDISFQLNLFDLRKNKGVWLVSSLIMRRRVYMRQEFDGEKKKSPFHNSSLCRF